MVQILLLYKVKVLLSMWKKPSNLNSVSNFGRNFQQVPKYAQIWPQGTMLQKFWKCEVKAWLSWNLIILPLLQFYMKSNFGVFKQSKNVILTIFRGSEFRFLVNLSNFQVQKLPKFKVLSLSNCQKWHFGPFEFTKIWFHVKLE